MAAIDTAITKNASGAMSLFPSLREELLVLQRKPLTYLTAPPFRWLWAVFFSTYAAANTADTLSRANGMSHTMPVLVSSTAANMSSAMAKDSAFAKMYGVTAPRPVPLGSYGCFFMRDIVSMAFFFTLPPLLSAELQARGAGKTTSDVSSQFLLPVAVQVVSNPWHLLGLNLYNEPKATAAERVQTVKHQLPLTIVARLLRIVPAFSLGARSTKRCERQSRTGTGRQWERRCVRLILLVFLYGLSLSSRHEARFCPYCPLLLEFLPCKRQAMWDSYKAADSLCLKPSYCSESRRRGASWRPCGEATRRWRRTCIAYAILAEPTTAPSKGR